ncbi:MAG TPA: ATP synthase F0 subunit B [Thermoanaerobaculia bacterium]
MSLLFPHAPAVISVALLLSQEETHEATKFLGLPLWIWQLLNLALFLGVLLYFVARPMAQAFRKRQLEVGERRKEAEQQRAEVQRLASEIRARTARLELEIAEVRRQGELEGESARAALAVRAHEEAERVRTEALDEIERRLAAAIAELRKTAADLTAAAAVEIVSREVTDEDRRRILTESVSRMKEAR